MNGRGGFGFRDVAGGYGRMTVVEGLSADVPAGGCLCVLGRNGVGKSTLMKILSGHLECAAGEILLDGAALGGLSPDRRRRLGLSYAMQERPVFDNLSVRDNLTLMRGRGALDAYRPFFEAFPVLEERLAQTAGTLSGGERKILSFVRAAAEDARVLLLDEPSEGVQAENVERMKAFILARKAAGVSIVVVEQHLTLAGQIADEILVMDQGRTVLQGPAAEIPRERILEHIEV